ncbi:efflux RND transporter periplasmic adaptor subunit [Alkalibacillus aidingensis]|uniref:efflux RND transporter periplasmic adaptor subunit n=1 Tax=Alkalibacillus aidingensis TaxID=2747607 RepID=UPI0016603693|nr:efflux RND transporter periplasmic adaptor subunit [Alkalibacillus aidingensis]
MKKWMLTMMVAAVVLLAACNEEADGDDETVDVETPVQVTELEVKDFTSTRSMTGRTMPSDQMPVMAESPGEVEELFVSRGDFVEEGEVLVEYRSPQFGLMEIEAPMDGMLDEVNMVEGRMITNEEPVAIVLEVDPLELTFSVTAGNRDHFSKGDEVPVSISQIDYEGEAEITYVSSTAGENGLFDIEAELEQPHDDEIPAGVTAQVYLEELIAADAFVVPTEAIVDRGADRYIFTVEDGVAKRVEVDVVTMQSAETAVEIVEEDAISEGDPVIVRGQLTIADGHPIRIVEED